MSEARVFNTACIMAAVELLAEEEQCKPNDDIRLQLLKKAHHPRLATCTEELVTVYENISETRKTNLREYLDSARKASEREIEEHLKPHATTGDDWTAAQFREWFSRHPPVNSGK